MMPLSENWPENVHKQLPLLLHLHQTIEAARRDANAFVEFVFTDSAGKRLSQGKIHRELQDFLQDHPRALIELPRDHGKSMQICGRLLWELGRDPGLRIKIVCATESLAVERGRLLRETLETNPRFQLVYPQIKPAQPWSDLRLSIQRPGTVLGPSIAAFGVGASSTGARADLLVCDDLVDVKSLHSQAERQRIKSYFYDNLLNLLEPDGRCWCLFTPWHPDDLNAELKRQPHFSLFRRAINAQLQPIWPERWHQEALRRRQQEIGSFAFARGYHLQPLTDQEMLIRPEWLQTWSIPQAWQRMVLAIDPAATAHADSDTSGMIVAGLGAQQIVHCLAAQAFRKPMPELIKAIAEWDRRWHPDLILFESNGPFQAVKDILIAQTTFGHKVLGIHQSKDKATRVAAFSVAVENGKFRLLENDPAQARLQEEMLRFPYAEHDDLLDAAMIACKYLLDQPTPRIWL